MTLKVQYEIAVFAFHEICRALREATEAEDHARVESLKPLRVEAGARCTALSALIEKESACSQQSN